MRIAPYLLLGPLAVGLAASGVDARPKFLMGGSAGGAGGAAQACDGDGTGVCAQFQDGQTFITWEDVDTGAAGAAYRYRVYRSTSPINSGNYTSATLIASYIFNNSAQLFGGNPDTGGAAFTTSTRQSGSQPMSKLTDLGTALPTFSGLQVYTALGTENAYYAVVSTNTSDGSPSYIGSVGPIAESVATPRPIKYAASGSRADNSYGQISSPAGLPVVFSAHASSANGGPATNAAWGDYWQWWLPKESGWQDGRATTMSVLKDNAQNWPSLTSALVVGTRDTIWTPDGTSAMETFHQGIGMTPNPLVGPANRWYPTTARGIKRMLNWVINHYGADGNRLHWTGTSMGAWGGANTGMRMTSPRFASLWLNMPVWRMDRRSYFGWPGNSWGNYPFRATIDVPPGTLGSVASSVLMDDGSTWGGNGGYADTPGFIAANISADLPVAHWNITKDDGYANWPAQIEAKDAFQTSRHGHAFVWAMGGHGIVDPGSIDCDQGTVISATCYGKSLYALNVPYIAFSNSSIDDNPGTGTRDSNGIFDGDWTGCVNCGFKWTVSEDSASAFNFTADNVWLDRSPTVHPQTTIAGSLGASGTGSLALTNNSGFLSTAIYNQYFLIGSTEIVWGTSTAGSNTMTVLSRGDLGTTARAHSSGETIVQLASRAIGPNGGPYSTMTVDITPRRIQGFSKGTTNGQTITCNITPNGGSTTQQTPTVANGIFTLTGVTINASGATSIACE